MLCGLQPDWRLTDFCASSSGALSSACEACVSASVRSSQVDCLGRPNADQRQNHCSSTTSNKLLSRSWERPILCDQTLNQNRGTLARAEFELPRSNPDSRKVCALKYDVCALIQSWVLICSGSNQDASQIIDGEHFVVAEQNVFFLCEEDSRNQEQRTIGRNQPRRQGAHLGETVREPN